MSLVLNTPPAAEPITLDQAKAHLKVDATDDDALITALIPAARARAEWHTGRAFVTQSWTLWLDCWPGAGWVQLPLAPLQSVASVTLYGCDGTPTVLDSGFYQVSQDGRVTLKPDLVLAPLRPLDAVAIAFTAGYGAAADVPPLICEGILEIIGNLYANRGDTELPLDALALLEPYRLIRL